MDRPRYALLVTIFDPRPEGGKAARSAGLTAAPAARAVIERVAPLLGVAPRPVSE
jgi:cell division protein FtsI (penicillin-binding protein 3)